MIFGLALSAWGEPVDRRAFDLPSGDASRTLKAFAQQSGEQIVYPAEQVRGIRTNGVHGDFTAREALDAMLLGTRLVAVQDEISGALAVRRASSADAGRVAVRDVPEPVAQEGGTAPPQDSAADDNVDAPVELDEFVVTGLRASLASAQARKRDRLEIIDAIVADDINKLPDLNVTDALQRISGIQITRDRGEGSGVAIRGLTQIETTVNGREMFTAGNDRNLDFQDVPAEMVAGIDVFKTQSARFIEGGLGGAIDLRTHKPFDFDGLAAFGTARWTSGSLVGEGRPQLSALVSDRWKLTGGGELGLLVNVAHQERAYRWDAKSTGNVVPRADIFPGQTVFAQYGSYEPVTVGRRERNGVTLAAQWRVSDVLELHAEAVHARFQTVEDTWGIFQTINGTVVDGSVVLFPGTNDVSHVAYENAGFTVLCNERPTLSKEQQVAFGGRWSRGALSVEGDFSHTRAAANMTYNAVYLTGVASVFVHDVSARVPSTRIDGTDLLDPSGYRVSQVTYTNTQGVGEQEAARLDVEYRVDDSLIKALSVGVRLARRNANNGRGTVTGNRGLDLSAADVPGLLIPHPHQDFFPGESASMIRSYLVADVEFIRDRAAAWSALDTDPMLGDPSPTSVWNVDEATHAAYLLATVDTCGAMPLQGNVGVRVVGTSERVTGFMRHTVDDELPTYAPIDIDTSYVDALPSLNLRLRLREGVYLRAAASDSLTRPAFNRLSPSISLSQNLTNPDLNTGSAGNPDLGPMRARHFDISIERYFSGNGCVFLAAFDRDVRGFLTTVVQPEVHDGVTYQVGRPQNADPATIRGIEVGFQQFFDFLPGWLGGFGMLANYTFVDSRTDTSVQGLQTPLQGLSRNSCNVIAMYERGPVGVRVAYNWRDEFFRGTSNASGTGIAPLYNEPYGWLDASFSFQVNEHVRVSIEGANLLNTMRTSYYSVPSRRHENNLDDRQILLGVSLRL